MNRRDSELTTTRLALALPEEVGVCYGRPDRGRTRVSTLDRERLIRIPLVGREVLEQAAMRSAARYNRV